MNKSTRINVAASAVLAVASLLIGVPVATASAPSAHAPETLPMAPTTDTTGDQVADVTDGSNYKGNPETEAALVAGEDKRLVQVRTVASIARWTGVSTSLPYRVASSTSYTLVLPARDKEYTIDDLLILAPKTFVRQPDNSYLLSENIVVEAGGTLTLNRPGPLTINMLSNAQKFVSIVSYGGKLNISGTADEPVRISSWDTDSGAPRKITDTGRAYIRSIGGTVAIAHAAFQNLGFWSGRTGGLSMTGSDRPVIGALDANGAKSTQDNGVHRKRHPKGTAAAEPAPAPAPEPEPGAVLGVPGTATAAKDSGLPNSDYSYVAASVVDTTVTDNVYGLFLANAVGASIHNVAVKDSRMDGIVLHRYVSDAVVVDTTVSNSAMNGFNLSRATRSVRLDNDKAINNGRNGIYVDGRPLATGPTATGAALTSSGSNVVLVNNMVTDSVHYGMEIRGGYNTTVQNNTIAGSQMGIVVADTASRVSVDGNHLSNQSNHAIALRDGVTDSVVRNNTVTGGTVGVYLRNAQAVVEGNTLSGITNHGISAIGTAGIDVKANTIAGSGPSAIDLKRAGNVTSTDNATGNWVRTRSLWDQLVSFFQPLTVMWTLLALLLLVTAALGHRRRHTIRHPYAAQAPMSTFTDLEAKLVRPDELGPVNPEVQPRKGSRADPAHEDGHGAQHPLAAAEAGTA
jgi:parallel beta-helix repeat protein